MSYAPSVIVERLLDSAIGAPWEYAPKTVQAAAKAADAAISAHLDTLSAVEDAEVGVPIAEAVWTEEGKASIRAGGDLPSRDGCVRAALALTVAVEDEHIAERKMQAARYALVGLLANQDTRDEWRTSIEKRATELQAALAKTARTIANSAVEAGTLLGFTHYLGGWGEHMIPPNIVQVDPAGALHKLANLKPWAPAVPVDTASRWQQPVVEDTRPVVWIVNDLGGIHNVEAKDADRLLDQPGWRTATDAEVDREHKRQGLKR
jgi:hypothetical protein